MNRYFATTAPRLESVAAGELAQLGASEVVPDAAGVHFGGDRALLYRVHLWARTIFRVLVPLSEFRCADAAQLYRGVRQIAWHHYLSPEQTLAVRCTGGNRNLNHSHFTALQVKNAIVDQQREQCGRRSSVDPHTPDRALDLHIRGNACTLSLDGTGGSLHRRGYRTAAGEAPLKEPLAAALLALAGWEADSPFLDPLCGAGTLPIEAGLEATDAAPGLLREGFAFQHWPEFDAALWAQLCTQARRSRLPAPRVPIFGSDRDAQAITNARTNAANSGLAEAITFSQTALAELASPAGEGTIVCNPPYGKRLGRSKQLGALYKQLGDTLKQRFKGWRACILTADAAPTNQIGLRPWRRIPLYNGSLACTLLAYELY